MKLKDKCAIVTARPAASAGQSRSSPRRAIHDLQDVAAVALFFASFPSNALTGQSLVVSHGWFMQ